jgi:hypothetical protein
MTAWSPILILPIWASVTDACTLKVPGEIRTMADVVEPDEPEDPDDPVEPVVPEAAVEPELPVDPEPEEPEPEEPAPDEDPPVPPDELELLLVPLEPPPETDWPGVMLTAPTVPAKGVTMVALPMFVWAWVSWAYAEACWDWAWAIDAWSEAMVCEVAFAGSAASLAWAELRAAVAEFSAA